MRRPLALLAILALVAAPAAGQVPIQLKDGWIKVTSDPSGSCDPTTAPGHVNVLTGDHWRCDSGSSSWIKVPGGGSGGSPGGVESDLQVNVAGSFGVRPGLTADASGNLSATSFVGPLTGNAATASALLSAGTTCPAGQAPIGVDANGNALTCTAYVEEAGASLHAERVCFDGTGGSKVQACRVGSVTDLTGSGSATYLEILAGRHRGGTSRDSDLDGTDDQGIGPAIDLLGNASPDLRAAGWGAATRSGRELGVQDCGIVLLSDIHESGPALDAQAEGYESRNMPGNINIVRGPTTSDTRTDASLKAYGATGYGLTEEGHGAKHVCAAIPSAASTPSYGQVRTGAVLNCVERRGTVSLTNGSTLATFTADVGGGGSNDGHWQPGSFFIVDVDGDGSIHDETDIYAVASVDPAADTMTLDRGWSGATSSYSYETHATLAGGWWEIEANEARLRVDFAAGYVMRGWTNPGSWVGPDEVSSAVKTFKGFNFSANVVETVSGWTNPYVPWSYPENWNRLPWYTANCYNTLESYVALLDSCQAQGGLLPIQFHDIYDPDGTCTPLNTASIKKSVFDGLLDEIQTRIDAGQNLAVIRAEELGGVVRQLGLGHADVNAIGNPTFTDCDTCGWTGSVAAAGIYGWKDQDADPGTPGNQEDCNGTGNSTWDGDGKGVLTWTSPSSGTAACQTSQRSTNFVAIPAGEDYVYSLEVDASKLTAGGVDILSLDAHNTRLRDWGQTYGWQMFSDPGDDDLDGTTGAWIEIEPSSGGVLRTIPAGERRQFLFSFRTPDELNEGLRLRLSVQNGSTGSAFFRYPTIRRVDTAFHYGGWEGSGQNRKARARVSTKKPALDPGETCPAATCDYWNIPDGWAAGGDPARHPYCGMLETASGGYEVGWCVDQTGSGEVEIEAEDFVADCGGTPVNLCNAGGASGTTIPWTVQFWDSGPNNNGIEAGQNREMDLGGKLNAVAGSVPRKGPIIGPGRVLGCSCMLTNAPGSAISAGTWTGQVRVKTQNSGNQNTTLDCVLDSTATLTTPPGTDTDCNTTCDYVAGDTIALRGFATGLTVETNVHVVCNVFGETRLP